MTYRIVETDKLGRDYPNESFVNIPPCWTKEQAKSIANAINAVFCVYDSDFRYWKVVESGYKLAPGFEP